MNVKTPKLSLTISLTKKETYIVRRALRQQARELRYWAGRSESDAVRKEYLIEVNVCRAVEKMISEKLD
jgi:hypothetical protein